MTKSGYVYKDNGKLDYPKMMRDVIRALHYLKGSGNISQIVARVVESENVSEEDQSEFQSGDTRLKIKYCLSEACVNLKKGGALKVSKSENENHLWSFTEMGLKIDSETDSTEEFEKILKIANQESKKINENEQTETSNNSDALTDDATSLDYYWKSPLLETLKDMDGYAFERLCRDVLLKAGFDEVKINSKKGADGGIDGSAILRVNLISFQIFFQCKCWKDAVTSEQIRNFRGALQGRADKGLFIATSRFTSSAITEAKRGGTIFIDLIDGDILCDLLKKHNLGVQTAPDGQVTITPEWFDAI